MKKTLAWHFIEGDKLRDGTKAADEGGAETYAGALSLCGAGLHFCRQPFDALSYAPGATLRLVDTRGEVLEPSGEDKGCCTERRIIAVMDATELCRYFARMQAISVIHLWDAPDIVLDYLMTGDESIRAAARAAAWDAAWGAAWAAARDAAWGAAWGAARAAAKDAARKDFNALVYDCFADYL